MATFTFDELLPTAKDKARALLGDTAVTAGTTTIPAARALLSDEHIAAVLALATPFEAAVAWLADELAVRFAQVPDSISDSGSALRWSERIPAWRELAARMRADMLTAAAANSRVATGVRLRGYPRPDYTLPDGDITPEEDT
jgi:hypothetical protein